MNPGLSEDTKTILLLCGVLGTRDTARPLNLTEYNRLVKWLISEKLWPRDMLRPEHVEPASTRTGIGLERMKTLLGRGAQVGFTVEEWHRNGIWIIGRSDPEYPARYKTRLRGAAPPLLFGVGDQSLLQGGGLAVVGSRNVDPEGEAFTREIGELCANNRMPIISGGARGVDRISMKASLDADGIAIGVLAENLLKKSLDRYSRGQIAEERLLLISPYHPKARFTVGTAMGRNKLIYGLADFGLVVSADFKRGGTWAGATEVLKRENHLPVFVRTGATVPLGNHKLLGLGALEWPDAINRRRLSQELADIAAREIKKPFQETLAF